MKNLLLAAAAVLPSVGAALAGPAWSADPPGPIDTAAPPAARAGYWTGCYVGGHAGGLRTSKQDWVVRSPGGDHFGQSLGGHVAASWLAGVQGGCDYQFLGGLVTGIRGDYGWTDAVGNHDSAREIGVAYHSNATSLVSVTGRVGYAWDRYLGYIKAGGAWERNHYAATTTMVGTAYTANVTRSGWTVGIGGEYAMTDFLSAFVEFDYRDFGTSRIGLTPHLVGLRRGFLDISDSTSVVRAGLNFRFTSYPLPIARN